jgi:hypothetical protein
MTSTPTDERAAYAEQLFHLAALVIGAVHSDEPDEIRQAVDHALAHPAPADVDPAVALATILAAQVDPDAPTSTRLGWLAEDRRLLSRLVGHPLLTEDPTVDRLDARLVELINVEEEAVTNVRAVLDGRLGFFEVPRAHRLLVVQVLLRRGLTLSDIARKVGCGRKTISKYVNRYLREVA